MIKFCSILILGLGMCQAQVKVTSDGSKIHVDINGKPYADFVVKSDAAMKPYLYPLRAASGTIVTRSWPMDKVDAIEPVDHQHQRGVWFGPDVVNGFDFWNNEFSYKNPIAGLQKLNKIGELESGKKEGSLEATFDWIDPKGTKIVEETEEIIFHDSPKMRIVDFEIDLKAVSDVKFGDGKDCCFGIRLNPQLQETKVIKTKGKPDETIPGPPGVITDAQGKTTEKEVWGKSSDWCDYSGEINGEKLGITILDNPKNSRRAMWHVRGYGLFAANPFGVASLSGDKTKDGSVTLKPGEKLHFKYRVIVHAGDAKSADIPKLWAEYAK